MTKKDLKSKKYILRWPPNKAWTSCSLINGFRHFVAINYGGKASDRWVNLVSVLDGNVRLRVLWSDMKDQSSWISGWESPSKWVIDEIQNESNCPLDREKYIDNNSSCLHPSEDSGLIIPTVDMGIRKWFPDETFKH